MSKLAWAAALLVGGAGVLALLVVTARPGDQPTDEHAPAAVAPPAPAPPAVAPAPPAAGPADPGPPFAPGFQGKVLAVAYRPDGKRVASGGIDGVLRTWDGVTGEHVKGVAAHSRRVWAVAYSADGKWLLSGGSDGRICVWNASTLCPDGELSGHAGSVRCLAVAPDGVLVSGGTDGTMRFWDLSIRKQVREVKAYAGTVAYVSSGGGWLVTTGWPGNDDETLSTSDVHRVRVWDAVTGRAVKEFGFYAAPAALSPDRRLLAGREFTYEHGPNGSLTIRTRHSLWDAETGRHLVAIAAAARSWVSFSPDGRLLATTDSLGRWQLWELATGGVAYTHPGGHSDLPIVLSPDGRRLACAGGDGRVHLMAIPPYEDRLKREAGLVDPGELWDRLADPDARTGYQAAWTLAAGRAVAVLDGCARPPADPDPARTARLIAELDAPQFQVRESAEKELRRLGTAAESALRAARAETKSAEVAARVESLLASLKPGFPLHGDALRASRAVYAVELMGTPESRQLLRKWAAGPRGWMFAQQATLALERIGDSVSTKGR